MQGGHARSEPPSYDNALAESVIGPHRTEPIKAGRPRGGFDDVEIETAEWVDF